MPWQTTNPVDQRMRFVAAHQSGAYTMKELCERYEITRQTGYKWIARCQAEGPAGLYDRSHAPKHCPHRMAPEMVALVVEARRAHPSWGTRKLRAWLARKYPGLALPAASTMGDLLKREGLVAERPRRRRSVHPGRKLIEVSAPNQVWAADFKGQFRTGDGAECYPLTISDAHTRFLLCCHAQRGVSTAETMPVFARTFEKYGLPESIRTDNGSPFAAPTHLGLTRLNVWWTKLGIEHDRIEPGRPDQNGGHERMHRTLKAEATRPPGRDQAEQQEKFDRFQREFDFERPHEALGQEPPASVYERSPRQMPSVIPAPEYAGHCEVRRVRGAGTMKFKGHEIFLSEALAHESVALEEVEDGIWSVYFYARLIGRLNERTQRVSG